MRLGVIRELKNVRSVIDLMEKRTKNRDPEAVLHAHTWLKTLVVMMEIGELSASAVEMNLELACALRDANLLSES